MSTKQRKTRKMRGSGGCGYGSKKKHRGKGSKGGKGYAGSHKHHYIKIMKTEPEHFGKRGFFSRKTKPNTINLGDIEKLTDSKEINLTEMGYGKLLGKGNVSKALNVKVASCSAQAKEKIERAGGSVLCDSTEDDFQDAEEKDSPEEEEEEATEEIESEEDISEEESEEEDD